VWMHLLLSWGFSLQGQFEDAQVEARKASDLLTATWSEGGHFDDALLRVILAALWTWSGSWDDARVDLRAAAGLDPKLTWAKELANRDAPPRNLLVALGGIGPEPTWDPTLSLNVVRGARELAFTFPGQRTPLRAEEGTVTVPLRLTGTSHAWYERHLVRDNAIQDVIQDSHYALNVTAEAGLHATKTAAAVVVFAVSVTAGVGVSYLVIQACASGCSADAFYLIIGAPLIGIAYGKAKYDDITEESRARLNTQTDPSNFYRFVRFLPEYAWVGWSDDTLGASATLVPDKPKAVAVTPETPPAALGTLKQVSPAASRPRLYFGHVPDVP
ncbi:MAG TPA: hypothetical protein VF678_00620, partial [bacterium]